MARIAIESEFQTSKMTDRSEIARNAIKSDFRTSKMFAAGHFVKNFNLFIFIFYSFCHFGADRKTAKRYASPPISIN